MANEESTSFNKRLGAVVRRHRELVGLSQTEMAKIIDASFQQLQKYEQGANRIPCWRLLQIARFIGASVDDMLREAGEPIEQREAGMSSKEFGRLKRAYLAAPPKVRRSAIVILEEAAANGQQ